ncbi:hypothetical protein SASPL_151047 [Salvia splendens]|uniref:Peptidase A1 domain-containing protein n=1 Tax=Salvia splendens TaxID=180675 RepID=A0A8X8Z2L6_SALSN|nr:hypothetical protein SASPL_151047 [Salvia splendens]
MHLIHGKFELSDSIKKRPSTLEVFHRHGPCSKLSQDEVVATPSLSDILAHDQSRVKSIRARLDSIRTMDKVKDEKVNLPAHSGSSLGSGNYLVSMGLATSGSVQFTPFDSSHGSSFYFISITSIAVSGQQLPIGGAVFKTAGAIIDSGTVITRLPPAAYSALSAAFKQGMKKYPAAPAFSILDTCYNLSNYTSISVPTVSFTFDGEVMIDLSPSGIMIAVSSTVACLAFAGNGDAANIGIFGNTQQLAFEVVYDVVGGKLGFAAAGC